MRYAIALAALVLAQQPSNALAHALLEHAEPRVGATVALAPREVSLWFTQRLEGAFSRIEVRDSDGARVDDGAAQVDGSDPVRLSVMLKPLQPGTYKVNWRVLSVDTHTTEGHFTFRVGSK